MFVPFLIMLREGLEAALIVSLIASYLKRTQRGRWIGVMWIGVFLAAALCLGLTGLFLLRSAWLTEAFSAVLSALCLFTPFEDFVNNSFSIPAVVYYLTVTAVFLFFTAQDIEKRRWN